MKESIIQSQIIDYLLFCESQNKLMFSRLNNIPPVQKLANGKMCFRRLPKGVKHGIPDIMIIKGGSVIFIEVKSDTGRQSEGQKIWEKNCLVHGAKYFLIRSVQEVVNIIEGNNESGC